MKNKRGRKIASVLTVLAVLTVGTVCNSASTLADSSAAGTAGSTTDSTATFVSPSTIHTNSDGGKLYTYDIDGTKDYAPVAPDGFNPLTATNAELEEYGFPLRPTDSQELANWENVFSHYKRTVLPGQLEVTTAKTDTNIVAHPNTNSVTSNATYPINTSNYAGYCADSISGQNLWVAVEGEFTEPVYDANRVNMNGSDCASWVGLGNNGRLIQAGTDLIDNIYGSLSTRAWYEILPDNYHLAKDIHNNYLAINQGNQIYVYASCETANNRAYFYILNETTGDYSPHYENCNISTQYDGSEAEWVNEKSSESTYLLDCDDVIWKNCRSYSADQQWFNLGHINPHQFIMYSQNGSVIMAPTGLPAADGGFTNHRVPNIF